MLNYDSCFSRMKCKRSGRGAGGTSGLDSYEEAADQEHAQVDGEHDRADAGRHRARNPCAEWRGNGSYQANNQRGLHMHQLAMPSITVCTFLTVTNGFKMFDQNLALTNGAPSNSSELLALNIYRTFYGRAGFEGVGQAKAVVFFIIVAVIALIQNKLTTSKEVQA